MFLQQFVERCNVVGLTACLPKQKKRALLKFSSHRDVSEFLFFWLTSVNATFTLHLHGIVTQLLIQVVGGASSRFACRQCHLDAGRFGTFGLASGHGRQRTQSWTSKVKVKSSLQKEEKGQ